nr:hypothetical protein [Clostridia bacterium]
MKNKKIIIEMIVSIIGVFLLGCGLICFNKYVVLSNLPLIVRMIITIIKHWMVALVPIIFCIKNKYKLIDLGFNKNKILKQVLIGITIACIMSIVMTLIPILIFGKENIYLSSNFKYAWQYI